MKYTSAQLRQQFQKLSEREQEYLFSDEVGSKVRAVGATHSLSSEQVSALASAVGLVLLKLLKPAELAHELAVELDIPPSKASAIAAEVEREILKNIPPTPPQGGSPTKSSLEGGVPTIVGTEDVVSKGERGEGGGFNLSRPVPIRKQVPVAPSPSGRAGGGVVSTLQTLLTDIRRGTAYDDNRLAEAYRKTPREVRDALESVGFLSRLQEIARKFGLNVEETGELVSEAGLVMIGLTKPHEFVDHLTHRLRLPRDRALAVGQAANMEIFRPVREILRKMNTPAGQPIPPTPFLKGSGGNLPFGEAGGVASEGLRFVPSVPASVDQNPPPQPPSFSKGGGSEAGGGFKPIPQKYDTDPYREPLT